MRHKGMSPAAAIAALLCGPLAAAAQPVHDVAASLLVFPKVIADGTRDTIIQIGNVSNSLLFASCWYVNGALSSPELPPGPFNPPLCTVAEFRIALTAQQPTHWLASSGRLAGGSEPPCSPTHLNCSGAGIDPGSVPPASEFSGHLLCLETDAAGEPFSGNHLNGDATVKELTSGDVTRYSAVGLLGLETNNGDAVLELGTEYSSCPQSWSFAHSAEGAEDPMAGPGSTIATRVTVVPCAQNLADQLASTVTLSLQVTNEFESVFTTSAQVTCWGDVPLAAISPVFDAASLGTPTARTRIGSIASTPGIFVAAEEVRDSGGAAPVHAAAAANLHVEGARPPGDQLLIPTL